MDKEKRLDLFDGVLWDIEYGWNGVENAVPICIKHRLKMTTDGVYSSEVRCAHCKTPYRLPRSLGDQISYIFNVIESEKYKKMKVVNWDDEIVPLATETKKDDKYFVTVNLQNSRNGRRLVVYAGEKGAEKKTQIFIDADNKKMAFDPNDSHPGEVFSKIVATFQDGSEQSIQK